MSGAWSKKRPWPVDAELDPGDGGGYVGLMLEPGQDGLLVGRTVDSLAGVSPSAYGYASQDPAVETTFTFGNLTGGMGQRVQSDGPQTRYRHALGVDCSIGGKPRPGPAFAAEAFPGLPAAAPGFPREVRQFIVAQHGITRTLFALVDQYVYRRTAGAWVLSKDFTAANEVMQAVEFAADVGGSGLWVATILGELWKYDGAAWTQAALPAPGAPAPTAFAERVERVGHSLTIGSGAYVWTTNAGDPLLAASWGGAIQVGSLETRISGLRAVGDTLFIFKWDGVYSLNADASDNELFPELRADRRVSNGFTAVPWRDRLRFPFGDAYYALDAGGALEGFGPERLVDLDPAMAGRSVSGAGWADWFLWLGTYNADVNTSYLLKYGTWTNTNAESGFEFLDAWHGAVAHWVGKRITRVDVVSFDTELDPSLDGPALWVGFDDGTVAYTPLPSRTPDPAGDDRCRFALVGDLYWPIHTAGYPATTKRYHAVAAFGPQLSASLTARQFYRPTPASAYVDAGAAFTTTGQRVELPDDLTGVELDTFTRLATTTDTLCPVLSGVALFESIRPQAGGLRLSWSFTARAADRLARRDGHLSRHGADRVRAAVRFAAANPGLVRLRLPDEEVGACASVAYAERLAPDDARAGLEWRIPVTLVQFRTVA